MRTLPFGTITGSYPRAVRDLACAQDKRARLELEGSDTQLDRVILEGLSESIAHLLRNAVAHGIETAEERERAGKPADGRVVLRAEPRGTMVAVEVADDGRGVAPEVVPGAADSGSLASVLSQPGFSTALSVTDVAGRGMGLDAVRTHVESFGGSFDVQSEAGQGTVVTLLLPYSVALMRVLLIDRGGQLFALPLSSIQEVTAIERTLALAGAEAIEVHGRATPLCDLAELLAADVPPLGPAPRAVVVCSAGARQAVACERIVGQQEVVLKSLGKLLAGVPGYLGGAILDSGTVAPVLDPAFLTRSIGRATRVVRPEREVSPVAAPKVLVVDDQFTVRELQRSILEAAGYRVSTAREGRDACTQLATDPEIELVLTDIDMPEMDGIELLASIRRDPRRATLPVVVLTSKVSESDRQRGGEAGANAYIAKDEFDQRTLLDTVERLLVA
jgi:two-component system chemotaxis sensor kinase CheA